MLRSTIMRSRILGSSFTCLLATVLLVACAGDSRRVDTQSPSSFIVTEAQFRQMFPNPIAFYSYADLVTAIAAFPEFTRVGGDTVRKQEAAAFFANVAHETLDLQHITEINRAAWPHYCDKSNVQYPCAPGKQYYGRGPIQISWNFNYGAAGKTFGVDLLAEPDLVAQDAAIAWKTALWYWMTQRGAAVTTPHDTMITSAGFAETIRSINGTLECNATGLQHEQMKSRVEYYRRFTLLLGVPTGSGKLTC